MNRFQLALERKNDGCPPIWLMRQAGRYHSHYQGMKKRYTFLELCRIPEVACETTMGPIRDFDFDAAILFSDLLFPLEAMGQGLEYNPGPKLDHYLKSVADVERLHGGWEQSSKLAFQGEALKLIRAALPESKGLLGFVGGPLTLFFYAVSGSHKGDLSDALLGMKDGRYEKFCDKLLDLLAENIAIQARSGPDTVAILDTCGGEVDTDRFAHQVVPVLKELIKRVHLKCPALKLAYYSKGTGPEYWKLLDPLAISYLGIDWNHDLAQVLDRWSERWAIQGNIDPDWMFLETAEFENRIRGVFSKVKALPASKRRGWVCGLGHGVLPGTPEAHVKLFVKTQREMFG